jgi:hypothetical protein
MVTDRQVEPQAANCNVCQSNLPTVHPTWTARHRSQVSYLGRHVAVFHAQTFTVFRQSDVSEGPGFNACLFVDKMESS